MANELLQDSLDPQDSSWCIDLAVFQAVFLGVDRL